MFIKLSVGHSSNGSLLKSHNAVYGGIVFPK